MPRPQKPSKIDADIRKAEAKTMARAQAKFNREAEKMFAGQPFDKAGYAELLAKTSLATAKAGYEKSLELAGLQANALLTPDWLALEVQYGMEAMVAVNNATYALSDLARSNISESIRQGLTKREGIKNLRRVLSGQFNVETIFRTQSQLAYNAGRWKADQTPEVQEILWGYEYFTVGDDRVRPSHAELEGTKRAKDDPFWETFWPPNGYNCRCIAIPIYDKGEETKVPDVEPDKGFALNAGTF